jgi:hypothetical protein
MNDTISDTTLIMVGPRYTSRAKLSELRKYLMAVEGAEEVVTIGGHKGRRIDLFVRMKIDVWKDWRKYRDIKDTIRKHPDVAYVE